jgi:NAD(P)-dependent dehydrogenase (short-subunit alcohol dehydrogenase family)
MFDLTGKVILVTGASSGIGKETARLLARRKAHLILSDVNDPDGLMLAGELQAEGHQAEYIRCDVGQAREVEALLNSIRDNYGKLDCAVNNAGIEHHNLRLADCDEALFDRTVAINLKGVFLCMKHEIRLMLQTGGGHIINLASIAGLRSAPLLAPYAASKHGVIGLTRTAAVEYARDNIRCNAVCPSFIRTPMVERAMELMHPKAAERLVKANPMQRLGEVSEIAEGIAWLCTEGSSFMTGQTLTLDGGFTA